MTFNKTLNAYKAALYALENHPEYGNEELPALEKAHKESLKNLMAEPAKSSYHVWEKSLAFMREELHPDTLCADFDLYVRYFALVADAMRLADKVSA